MTKTVNTEYNFWLSGYYDDFNSARATADDANLPSYRTLDHTISHFGSALGGVARLNPRFRNSFPNRVRTGGYHDDDPQISADSRYTSTAENKLAHNDGYASWLSRNIVEVESELYNSRAILQYPISFAGNRQKYNGASGDSYLAFRNGHDSQGQYFVPLGEMDFSYGSAPTSKYDERDLTTSANIHKAAGNPISYYQKGNARTSAKPNHDTPDKTMTTCSIASVYTGEKPTLVASATSPAEYLHEVKSPSKMPFLIHNLFVERGNGHSSASTTTATNRLISYDGPLRLKGIGESFHLRINVHAITNTTLTYTLKIGYKGTTTYNKSTNDFADTQALISVNFTLANLGLGGAFPRFVAGDPAEQPSETANWADIEVVPDFTTNQWKAYANGSTTQFAQGPINISGHNMPTAIGWSLDLTWAHGSDDYVCVSTLLDRVGVALPLTNKFDGNHLILPPVQSFNINYGANQVSSAEITVLDDENNFTLAPLTTGSDSTEWRLLMFESGEDRPIWTGHIESVEHAQNTVARTISTKIRARDSFGVLGRTLPIWELGQNAFFSLNNHISMAATIDKKSHETTAISNLLLFGIGHMKYKQNSLGFTRNDQEEHSRYSNILGGRQSLFSSSLIQMYINEDENGPNDVENQWMGFRASTNVEIEDILYIRSLSGTRDIYIAYDGVSTQSGSAYRGYAVGDTIKLVGTAYDGDYPIATIRYEYTAGRTASQGKDLVVLRITDSSAATTDGRIFTCPSAGNSTFIGNDKGGKRWQLTSSSAHGLSIGDTISLILDTNQGQSPNNHQLLEVVVQAVPTTTTFHIDTISNISVATPVISAYNYSTWNGATNTPPKNPAIVRHGFSNPPNQTEYDRVQFRVAHARWMRDLPQSTWFKARFGVIHPEPFYRAGKGSALQHPLNATQAARLSWINSDGSNNWTGLASSVDAGDTTISFDEPGMWYSIKSRGIKEFIVDLIDTQTGETQFVIANAISNPSAITTPSSFTWDTSNKRFELAGNHGFELGQMIVHEGFGFPDLDGIHTITAIPTSKTYKTRKITGFRGTRDGYAFLQARALNDGGWSDGGGRVNNDPDQIVATTIASSAFADGGANRTGKRIYSGGCTISGVKGLKRTWKPEHTIYNLRQVDESNGYKHCFVGWADMRNDGTANADGGFRQNDFGLMLPTNENYQLNLTFADQVDQMGNPDVFAELKIGEDADIWSFDADVEPYSGGKWSALTGGSNEEPFATHLRNWETKAGSFVVVDVSRFWNLNTLACGGRSGYDSGGIVDFGDFETPSFGFPYLIDNYWKEATCSYKNSHDESIFPHHPNSLFFINDGTSLKAPIAIGDSKIYLEDATQFDTTGYGVIIAEGGSNRDSEKIAYYYYWNGKGSETHSSGQELEFLNNVFITEYEVITDPKNAVDQLTADITAGSTNSQVVIETNEFAATEADEVDGAFDKVRIYNTTAALYGMRLILNMEGTVKSPAQGTFFSQDKVRVFQNLNLADTWATDSTLPCISDINNVPYQNTNNGDSFGSMLDARGQTIQTILSTMQEKDGSGIGGAIKSLSWLMGRDNRMEFRDSLDTNITLSRSNLFTSNLSTQTGSKITNVRVYYNGNASFVDHPTTIPKDVRWRVLNHPDLFNQSEALDLAKQAFHRESTPRVSIKAEPFRDGINRMVGDGRFGYVADTFRKAYHNDSQSLSWWSNRLGGHPFCGIQNALDSGATTSSGDATLGAGEPYAQLQDESFPATFGFTPSKVAKTSGSGTIAYYTKTAQLIIRDAGVSIDPNTAEFRLDGNGGTRVAITSAGWYQLPCTIGSGVHTLSVYYDGTTLASQTTILHFGNANVNANGTRYHFYGTNSLSHAIQVAYVQNGCPFVSATSGNELRMFIETITGASSYADTTFKLHLCDFDFNETVGSGPAFTPPTLDVLTKHATTSVVLDSNGFVSIQVPSSYSSTQERITFSVNLDYLRDVVRLRGGDTGLNLPSSYGITLSKGTSSGGGAFPMGMRRYPDMGGIADERAAYYAPRLHIVRDVKWVPATTITYTDALIDMTSQSLVIKDVRWSQNARDVEKVQLGLEKIEDHYAYNLVAALRRPPVEGDKPKPKPRPPSPTGPYAPSTPETAGSLGGDVATVPHLLNAATLDGDPSTVALQNSNFGPNQMSNAVHRLMRGKANFRSDTGSSGSTWGVLGSANTGVSSSFDRAIDGIEGSTTTSEGAAIATSDGFSLAGISDPEVGVQGERHSHTINARVPNDTSTGFVSVIASTTLEDITGGGNAEITTTIECVETGATITTTKIVSKGSARQNFVIVPSTHLNGAETPNNTLKITVERKPAQGNDAAGYQTLTIHNLEVRLRRYNIPQDGQSKAFIPY